MKKIILVAIMTCALLIGTGGFMQYKTANAAIPVIDMANIAETHATFLQTVQTVANTLTQIQNQVLELTSMSPESLLAHVTGVNTELSKIQSTITQVQGLMDSVKTTEQVWQSTFSKIDHLFDGTINVLDGSSGLGRSQNMAKAADQTYQDALQIAKTNADISQEMQTLKRLMDENQSAVGNKHAAQTQNALLAQQNELLLKQQQTSAAMVSAMTAHYAKENQKEAEAEAVNKKYVDAANQRASNKTTTLSRGWF